MKERIDLAAGNSAKICMFSPETWAQAEELGYKYCAFPESQKKRANRIRVNDIIFTYVTKRMTITGILLVQKSCSYIGDSKIYGSPGQFPNVVQTKPLKILNPSDEIPLRNHFFKISIFRGLRDGSYWYTCLRNSPTEIRNDDFKILSNLILEN